MVGNRLGQHGLPATRGAEQQHPAGGVDADLGGKVKFKFFFLIDFFFLVNVMIKPSGMVDANLREGGGEVGISLIGTEPT